MFGIASISHMLCSFLVASILVLRVSADGSFLPYKQCDSALQSKDGPGGFKTTYRVGNRVEVNMGDALISIISRTPKDIGGHVTALVSIARNADDRHPMTKFVLKIDNKDNIPRLVQLAFMHKKGEQPYGLFTVRKSPGVLDYGCVNLERSYEDSYITVQAF